MFKCMHEKIETLSALRSQSEDASSGAILTRLLWDPPCHTGYKYLGDINRSRQLGSIYR